MKLFLIVAATFASLVVQAQNKNPAQKILIGFNFSPDYSFRTLKNNDASNNIVLDNRNNIEIAKFGYTTGLDIIFNSDKQMAFETGIQYSNKGYKTTKQNLYYTSPGPNLPSTYRMTYAYQYIGIPLKARIIFGKSKLHFITSAGLMTNFLFNLKHTATYEYIDGKTEKHRQSSTSGFNKIDVSPMISIGIDYKINGKIHLTAEPTFRYGIIKTVDASIVEKLWSAGVNVGFYYAPKPKK